MKPIIRYRRKVWDCKEANYWITGVWGFGSTPIEAYEDWLRQEIAFLLDLQARAA